jgi:DNA-binding transcriptional ArsR family regulator
MTGANTEAKADTEVTGTSLRIYTYLFLHSGRGIGAREVQRALGFKSPSSAIFHLEKLRERGLAHKAQNGEYSLIERRKIGVLSSFVEFRRRLVPRLLLHATLVTFVATTLTLLFVRFASIEIVLAMVPSIVASIALWIETYKVWTLRPRLRKPVIR